MTDLPVLVSVSPSLPCALDPNFRPISLGNRAYRAAVEASGKGVPLALAVERHDGLTTVYQTEIFPPGSGRDEATRIYVERLVKFLLWQMGGWKLTVGGPPELGAQLPQI